MTFSKRYHFKGTFMVVVAVVYGYIITSKHVPTFGGESHYPTSKNENIALTVSIKHTVHLKQPILGYPVMS